MKSHGIELAGTINSSDGVEAIEIRPWGGKVKFKDKIEVDGTAQFNGTVKITKNSPADGKVLYATNSSGLLSYSYISVPSNEIIIFDDDNQVTGYTLLYDIDDEVVYITKGSANGGETGGTSTGTWTQPTHTHSGYTGYHQLTIDEMPSHTHPPQSGYSNFHARQAGNKGESGESYGSFTYTDYEGGDQPHRHDLSNIVSDGTPSTWRPRGRNFTRQQKN